MPRLKQLILIGAFITVIVLAVVVIELVSKGSNPLPKFVSYFDRPGIIYIKYKSVKNTTDEEWIDFRSRKDKLLITEDERVTELTLADSKKVKIYYRSKKNVLTERLSRGNEPVLMRFINDAKMGMLVEKKRKGGVVLYGFKADRASRDSDPEWLEDAQIALAKESGRLRWIKFRGERDSLRIVSTNRLSDSEANGIFRMKEIPKKITDNASRISGYTADDLRKFNKFTPYWLGEEVDGAKVSAINSYEVDGVPGVYIAYGPADSPVVAINEFPWNSEPGQSAWRYSRPVKDMIIDGRPVKLQDGDSPRIFIKLNNTLTRIDGLKKPFTESDKLIKIIDEQLQQP